MDQSLHQSSIDTLGRDALPGEVRRESESERRRLFQFAALQVQGDLRCFIIRRIELMRK